ncbi:hypothetical protein ErPhphiEa104_gp022 [Erwinia phage phiEa104]|uniref:Uncharacterized protein n=6 Tax=Caudoviricetes TaxID=2731619 RepID=A0A346FHR2_9CAUD|nr:hypothetical protein Ea21-4_gp20 [Erwinia phage phiEa21-4]YP_004326997.1 hypothetical protein ErPhphiEa104_gp022 [Erwinia phage phiEa104]AXN57342.1 hypothetical protein SUNLIREN_20 [Erwinia phage SunLIRen]AYD79619.1 hypothetical protein LINGLNFE_00137 [Enterobacter phage phi63_307]QEG07674.1 hypothetical protein [Salmonella phage SE5]UFD98335.1 hypothetical protein SPARTY_12 [Hafnia phage vB_HalM_SPARTY]UXD79822.1 hypothetical protein 4Roscha1_00132 [Erwinia phage Roscha1]WJN64428.1 hypot
MKIFFSSRSAMRSATFGKATDNGKEAAKRWSRDFAKVIRAKRVEVVQQVNSVTGKVKPVKVTFRKSRKVTA